MSPITSTPAVRHHLAMNEPQHPEKATQVTQVTRLNAIHKRKLKALVKAAFDSGAAVFVPGVRRLVRDELGLDVPESVVRALLSEFGFAPTRDLQPYFGSAGEPLTAAVWKPAAVRRAVSAADQADMTSERLSSLTEAFVADLLEDPQLSHVSLEDKAVEAARVFAATLGAAVAARARFGAVKILPACADISAIAFKGAMPTHTRSNP